jgi:hypothetical protein
MPLVVVALQQLVLFVSFGTCVLGRFAVRAKYMSLLDLLANRQPSQASQPRALLVVQEQEGYALDVWLMHVDCFSWRPSDGVLCG